MNKNVLVLILFLANFTGIRAQDSVWNIQSVVHVTPAIQGESPAVVLDRAYCLNYKNFVAPTVLIGFGFVGLKSNGVKKLNTSTRDEIFEHQVSRSKLDNYTQYAPAALVYGLNAFGINGKHNFRDRTLIYATSQLISAAFVVPLKNIIKEPRPDGSNSLSFPSGHAATAFSTAHFMFREYKDTNFWLGASAYSFALFSGAYRTINDRHWVNDVVAGAGFGILSTELSYWLYPKVDKLVSGKEKKRGAMIMPYYQNKSYGLGLASNF